MSRHLIGRAHQAKHKQTNNQTQSPALFSAVKPKIWVTQELPQLLLLHLILIENLMVLIQDWHPNNGHSHIPEKTQSPDAVHPQFPHLDF